MEDPLNLHHHKNSFKAAIQATSDRLNIPPVFIEKDYWLTLVLKRLAESEYRTSVVFKGGTSLSKGFRLIDRFSEDIDIAVIDVSGRTGNQVKTLIREVEKRISVDLAETIDSSLTSKGSRFRKSVYTYPTVTDTRIIPGISNKLIIEINSFANPLPYKGKSIESLIAESLSLNNQPDLIEKFDLNPFPVNILDKRQTLLEKLVSLLRSSFEQSAVTGLSGKIRHFYDLYFLFQDSGVRRFIDSKDFPIKLLELWDHDQLAFEEPVGWRGQSALESPLFVQWPYIWGSLEGTYQKQLSVLAYSKIPDPRSISEALTYLIKKLSPTPK
jgi:hypothetical protein